MSKFRQKFILNRIPSLFLVLMFVLSVGQGGCNQWLENSSWLQTENSDVKQGNALFDKKEYAKAIEKYDNAAKALPGRGEVHLNRALALLSQGEEKLDAAMQALTLAADSDAPKDVLSRAEFNLGNAFFQKEDFKAAIEHFKKSLILSPGNKDAAWNLEVARLQKKKQEEQQKQDQENKDQENQDGENQDQEDQGDENQDKDGENKDNKDPSQDKNSQDQQDEEKEKQQPEPEPQEPKDEEKQQDKSADDEKEENKEPPPSAQNKSMERMLNALDKEDNDFHKNKAQQRAVGAPAHSKDW